MKRKVFLMAVVLCLVMTLVAAMTACDLLDKLNDLDEENNADESGDQSGESGASAEFEYKSSAAVSALDSMRQDKGYLIRYSIVDSDESDATVVSIGAKGNIYYVASGAEETYYDAGNDTGIVFYSKQSADEEWQKTVMKYSADYTKEDATEAMQAVIGTYSGWLTYYDSFTSSMDGVTKSTATVAGRSCDKFTFSAAALTGKGINMARASYECCVDKSSAVCLKWHYSVTADGESHTWTMECTQFNTNPDLTLPTVQDADEE